MHISKPYLESGVLVVNVINPTAGLLSGDRIESRVVVESGARLLLSTPSASRAHCMPEGWASIQQEYAVQAGASLENWPELLIPQGGARYRQHTTLRVEQGGELMFWELLAPGRVASGEVFKFIELDWRTELYLAHKLVLRERYRLVPGEPNIEAWRSEFPTGYYASAIILNPRLSQESQVWQSIHHLHSEDAWVGCSSFSEHGWTIRVLARNSVALRRTIAAIRTLLYSALGDQVPSVRRAGG
jgi:urease accessory protein